MLKPLSITGSDVSPAVVLNKQEGRFEITGRSLMDDGIDLYQSVIDWMNEYANVPNPETHVQFKLDYLNIPNAKNILDLLNVLERIPACKVVWYFRDDEEDMEEVGQDLCELTSVPFEFVVK